MAAKKRSVPGALARRAERAASTKLARILAEATADIDIDRYAQQPNVRHLTCLVFDYEGKIANPRGLEKDLSKSAKGIGVTVLILDR